MTKKKKRELSTSCSPSLSASVEDPDYDDDWDDYRIENFWNIKRWSNIQMLIAIIVVGVVVSILENHLTFIWK